jgi:hypothetical protein
VTFWIGLLALGGVSLAGAAAGRPFLPAPAAARAAGLLLVALVAATSWPAW